MKVMKANYHTHTARCGHAKGTDEQYVRAAIAQNFDVLGFSDHVPWPYASGYTHTGVRMTVDRLDEYIASLRALKARYAAGYVGEDGIRAEIRRVWQEEHYLMDTHTAVASAVLRQYVEKTGDTAPSVIVSTASPYKFGASVLEAIAGRDAVAGLDDFACCRKLSQLTGEIRRQLDGLEE